MAPEIMQVRMDDLIEYNGRRTTGMNHDFREAGSTTCADFSPYSLPEIDDAWPDDESPAQVTKTMFCRVEWECRDGVGVNRVADEAAGCMGVQAEHEEEGEVVGIPEGLETLLTNLLVGSRVHDDHDQQHEMPRNASRLRVVDLQGRLLTDFWTGG